MPVAYLQEFEPGDRSTTNYDAINERLGTDENPPEGLLVHTAGFTDDGTFRIYDVWESREHAERFRQERLMPVIQEVMAGQSPRPPVKDEMYDLHHAVAGRQGTPTV